MVDGSGQVFTVNLSNLIPDVSTSSIANALNSFVPEGYFILQQQFGISPFLAFILVALMIMMLYYLFAYILLSRLFNDSNLFENIKRPLLVFVFTLGVLSAYAIGYLVYIFEIILAAVAVSIFILILILVSSGVVSGYKAGNFIVHKVAAKEATAARERYNAERNMHAAKEDLIKIKERIKKMEQLLKEKRFGRETWAFKEYKNLIKDTETIYMNILNNLKNEVDRIESELSSGNVRNYDQYAIALKILVDSANAKDGIIETISAAFQRIENSYKNFLYGSSQGSLSQQYIYRLITAAKNNINGKIGEINTKISFIKSYYLANRANAQIVNSIGQIKKI